MRIVMRTLLALGLVFGAAMAGCDRKGATVEEKEVTVEKQNGTRREVTVETRNGEVDRALDKAGEATQKALDKADEATQKALNKAGEATQKGLNEADRAVDKAGRRVDVDVEVK